MRKRWRLFFSSRKEHRVDNCRLAMTTEAFTQEMTHLLPLEEPYAYHKRLSTEPVHVPRRDPDAPASAGELALPEHGWRLVCATGNSPVLRNAALDFQDYLLASMQVQVVLDTCESPGHWQMLTECLIVGTREQMPGCGAYTR